MKKGYSMVRTVLSAMAILSIVALVAISSGFAADKPSAEKPATEKLPDVAAAAVKAAYPSATVEKTTAETADGVTTYEVALVDKGMKMEVEVMESGTILGTEMAVSVKDLPKAVTDAVAKAAPGAEIKGAEKAETLADAKTGKLATPKVAYEIDVAKDGKEGEIAVSADGKVTEELKWQEQGKEKADKD
jgi:hypothetical protein